ncbi:hypothetical protein M422DRAFT_267071, partial [Sphaerobolus stellatus SS14]
NVVKRYLDGQKRWEKKFGNLAKKVEAKRIKNLHLAENETIWSIEHLQERLFHATDNDESSKPKIHEVNESVKAPSASGKKDFKSVGQSHSVEKQGLGWSWIIDGEHPPSSSIVCRRDTEEARKLARIADMTIDQEESKFSGNRLWTVLVNFLTTSPEHKDDKDDEEEEDEEGNNADNTEQEGTVKREDHAAPVSKRKSILRRLKSFSGKA